MKKKAKSILIFGAGINQITLIEACNDLGYSSVVIDPNENPPGKSIADYYYQVKGDDYLLTKQIALDHNINGIATSQMENPLKLMARLADDLKLIFNSPKIIEQSTNKWQMKTQFEAFGVPHAQGFRVQSINDIEHLSQQISFPCVIKPVDAHSSRGVFIVSDKSQLFDYYVNAISFSKSTTLLIEEYLCGKEYSVESVTYQVETTIVQVTEKIITPPPHTVELGHIQPAELSKQEFDEVERVVKHAILSLGLDNTVSHTEVKIEDGSVKVIEVGPRMGGDFISSYLTLFSSGVNLDKATINLSIGERPDLEKKCEYYSYVKYFMLEEGRRIRNIMEYDAQNNDEVFFQHLFCRKDDLVPALEHSASRSGVVIVRSNSREDVEELADLKCRELIKKIQLC